MRKDSLDRIWILLACLVGWTAGCQKPRDVGSPRADSSARNATPLVVTLKLLVVDDPELASGIKRLRGEWAERSGGGRLQVLEWALSELVTANSLPADLVIYPSRYLGALVQGNCLRPLRDSVLLAPRFARTDLLPAIRDREIVYGGGVYALPYGSPPLMLCYNSRVLQAAGCEVPQTWADYRQVVRRLQDQAVPCQLPLADKSAAITLLARAVSYARQGGRMALLFDAETFQPRIAGPPFVRALAEIAVETLPFQKAGQGETAPAVSRFLGFRDAVKEVAMGQSGMTMGWPGIDCPQSLDVASGPVGVSYAPMPRAKDCYSATRNQWEANRIDTPITLLGVAGRLASVTTTSRNAATSFKLLLWLGSGETATGISARSRYTLWYRHSQVGVAQRWQAGCQGPQLPGQPAMTGLRAAMGPRQQGVARTVAKVLASEDCFLLPRIPGIDQYLESLANAVRSAIAGETATAVLVRAADQWEQITGRLGREGQKLAYRAHLGL